MKAISNKTNTSVSSNLAMLANSQHHNQLLAQNHHHQLHHHNRQQVLFESPVVSTASDLHYCPVTQFIGDLLKLLTCQNEKFGCQVQRHIQDLLGNELSTLCYPILFEQIKLIIEEITKLLNDHRNNIMQEYEK